MSSAIGIALQQVGELQNYVRGLQQQGAVINQEIMNCNLRNEISELKTQVQTLTNKIKELEDDLHIMGEMAKEARFSLNFIQEDLVAVSGELAQLYHHVCTVNGETPSRIMPDHVEGSHIAETVGPYAEDLPRSLLLNLNPTHRGTLKEKLKSEVAIKILLEEGRLKEDQNVNRDELVTPSSQMLHTIRHQLDHLSKAVENTTETRGQKTHHTGKQDRSSLAELEDLQGQVIKLKSSLSTKREQITTLRTVLKANKQTAEVVCANLKSKYENEKVIVRETMVKLRNELNALKKDAETFASLRAMFAARCEEHETELHDLQQKLAFTEEQKRTLMSLLGLAIHQKLTALQKLEEYEMDKK